MTAYTPPPAVTIEAASKPITAALTPQIAARHATAIKAALDRLESAVAELPDGPAKTAVKMRALRLHNELGRGGRVLNAHFQTADISPDSAGGDKDGGGDDNAALV